MNTRQFGVAAGVNRGSHAGRAGTALHSGRCRRSLWAHAPPAVAGGRRSAFEHSRSAWAKQRWRARLEPDHCADGRCAGYHAEAAHSLRSSWPRRNARISGASENGHGSALPAAKPRCSAWPAPGHPHRTRARRTLAATPRNSWLAQSRTKRTCAQTLPGGRYAGRKCRWMPSQSCERTARPAKPEGRVPGGASCGGPDVLELGRQARAGLRGLTRVGW